MTEEAIRTRQPRRSDRVAVNIYLTKQLARLLDTRAEDLNRSRSDVAREILETELSPSQREKSA